MSRPLIFAALCLCLAVAADRAKAADGDPVKGKEGFDVCASCHSLEDERKVGPSLKGLFHRKLMGNGQKPTEETVRKKIEDGGNGMPAFKESLSETEIANLIAFLKTV